MTLENSIMKNLHNSAIAAAVSAALLAACGGGNDAVVDNTSAIAPATLTRIFTTPYGSETTSPFYYRNLNGSGFDYMTAVVQHPYDESDTDKTETGNTAADSDMRAYAGYIGPFPHIAEQTASSTDYADFTALKLAETDAEMREAKSSPSVKVNGTSHDISFVTMFRSGDQVGTGTNNVWGQHVDVNGDPIVKYSKADNGTNVSYSPDHTSLLTKDGKIFSITQFEEGAGMMYISELTQDLKTGALSPVATKPVDLSSTYGGYTFCAGMPTPWGSHLGGEEYPTNANQANVTTDGYFTPYLEYFGYDATDGDPSAADALLQTSVYRIGYPVEVSLTGTSLGTAKTAANAKADKHYSMGRLAWELAYVMPDQKTVYAGDDGSNRGMMRFVADTAGDLSSGTLYAAKLYQKSADNGGSFDISWINLGHASDREIDGFIAQGIQFADMFDTAAATGNACPSGFLPSEADGKKECLKLKTSNGLQMSSTEIRQAASRLEPLRYGAMLGSTNEFNKFEGITYDAVRKKLYLAISDITGAMSAAPTLAGLSDDISLTANRCGGVYQLNVDPINYATTNMSALVLGKEDSSVAGNSCDVNGIANPDNVVMGPTKDVLIIGEDTGRHRNDVMWAYQLPAIK
jgi:hypothetical protein